LWLSNQTPNRDSLRSERLQLQYTLAVIFARCNNETLLSNSTALKEMDDKKKSHEESQLRRLCIWGSSSAYLVGPFIEAIAKSHQYKYIGGGQNGEWGNHTIARLGARPFNIRIPAKIIPADAQESIMVKVANSFPRAAMRKFGGELNGVHGMLTSSPTSFTFTRSQSGTDTLSAGEYNFIPDIEPIGESDIVLLWIGKNDLNAKNPVINNQDIIVKLAVTASEWLSTATARVAVLGHFANFEAYKTSPELFAKIEHINTEYARVFGKQYFDVPSYLYSPEVWFDTEISPTPADLSNQSHRCLPVSLARDHGAHLNDKANIALACFLEKKMKNLGWI